MEKAKIPKFLVGIEIETKIHPCDFCHECQICNDCPVCRYCIRDRDYCTRCNVDEIIDYMVENEIISGDKNEIKNENGEIDHEKVCDLCIEHEVWREVICSDCNPCEDCEYYRNINYCPLDDYDWREVVLPEDMVNMFETAYVDGSCGLEFPTVTFSSLKQLHELLRKFVDIAGEDNLDAFHVCGGHTNISFEGWTEREEIIKHNAWYFLDLLSYMFLNKDTWRRWEYKTAITCDSDFYEKYSGIYIKYYAVEYRFPDSPNNPDNHVLLTAVLLGITMLPYKIGYDDDELNEVNRIYNEINDYGNFEAIRKDKRAMNYLRDKLKVLIKHIRPYLKEFSKELGYDLEKALIDRFNNPQWLNPNWTLERFKLKTIPAKTIHTNVVQLTLFDFVCRGEVHAEV